MTPVLTHGLSAVAGFFLIFWHYTISVELYLQADSVLVKITIFLSSVVVHDGLGLSQHTLAVGTQHLIHLNSAMISFPLM